MGFALSSTQYTQHYYIIIYNSTYNLVISQMIIIVVMSCGWRPIARNQCRHSVTTTTTMMRVVGIVMIMGMRVVMMMMMRFRMIMMIRRVNFCVRVHQMRWFRMTQNYFTASISLAQDLENSVPNLVVNDPIVASEN